MDEAIEVPCCPKCSTPLNDEGVCVTCSAEEHGLGVLIRSGYASIREMFLALQAKDMEPEMERVPPRREEENHHPLWNLYVPMANGAMALGILQENWADLIEDPDARLAAARGIVVIDLDKGGEISCPACTTRFTPKDAAAECPECGLTLGQPMEAAPDEAEG